MDATVYKYGVFPFGLGLYGNGPVLHEGEEMSLIKYGDANQKVYTSLYSYGDVTLASSVVFAVGDVKVSKDDGVYSNIATLPTVSGTKITVGLSQSETEAKQINILFKDQSVPPLWNDKVVTVQTYGDANAYLPSDFTNTDLSEVATSAQVDTVQNAVNQIPTDNNGIVVSASNVDYGAIMALLNQIDVTTTATVSEVLGSDVDGLTMQEALTRILAWATGKIQNSGNQFQYYKQDNTTLSFVLSASDDTRTRL